MFCGTELWKSRISLNMIQQTLHHDCNIEVFPDIPCNLYEALAKTTSLYPDKTAIIDNYNRSYSFTDFKEKVDIFSSFLKNDKKIKRGSHVALMLYNSMEFCVAFLSLIKLGAVTIPLPTKYTEQEVKSLIDKSDIEHIICDVAFYDWFLDYEKSGTGIITSSNAELGYGFFAYSASVPSPCFCKGKCTDMALLMFTSGTTSQSKGVVIKNFNIMHAIVSYQQLLNITQKDISIIPIPIYHITGLVALLGLFIYTGGTLYLHKYFNADQVLTCVQENHVTFLHASPTVFSMLLSKAENYPNLPSLRTFACGSSNMPKQKLQQIHNWLPNSTFHTVYGLTETTSPAAIFPGDAATSSHIGSSGFPIPGTTFRILDENKQDLPQGQVGEIWISGTVVLDSYYHSNAEVLDNGWLGTGDLGYFDSDGYLFVVDRKKDMINRGGEKIWCFDVENELYKIQGIEEAAVVGIDDEIYGELPIAALKISDNSTFTEETLKQYLKNKIAKYKIPARFLILEEIPITPNGKTDKKAIRALFTSQQEDKE